MSCCPACKVEFDVDEFDVDRDDELSCPECGTNLVVTTVAPVELALAVGIDVANDRLHDDDEQAEPFP